MVRLEGRLGGLVILLDTNYLIRILVPSSEEFAKVSAWIKQGEPLTTAALCWYEFCCGPVTETEQSLVFGLLRGEILPLDETAARRSAELFNGTGRARSLKVDSLVAGTALAAGARLTTSNLRDFRPFVPWGLVLAQ